MFQPSLIQRDFCSLSDAEKDAFIVPVTDKDVLLKGLELPGKAELTGFETEELLEIGSIDGRKCYGTFLRSMPEKTGLERLTGRSVLAAASQEVKDALCRAREMILWRKQHVFCGCCRTKLEPSKTDLAMVCGQCGSVYFPQISPAVIVAITRNEGREILLAHNRRFQDGVYSLIAGFVEAGESAESAVHREIREETCVEVDQVSYVSSQPWPFPNSLMLAFQAQYVSGEPCPDGTELSDCRWFTAETLPRIPEPGSIARAVMDLFIAGKLQK